MKIQIHPILFVLCVAFANIGLNIFTRKAATSTASYSRALTSTDFLIALIIGTCSALSLLAVYRSDLNLSQGILLMGAISIVGGSLIGVFVFGNRLQMGEWFLLAAVIILFGYRWLANA